MENQLTSTIYCFILNVHVKRAAIYNICVWKHLWFELIFRVYAKHWHIFEFLFVESWADECQYIFMNESIWVSCKGNYWTILKRLKKEEIWASCNYTQGLLFYDFSYPIRRLKCQTNFCYAKFILTWVMNIQQHA